MTSGPLGGAAAFDALAGAWDYPIFVVTTAAEGTRAGCLVGFATQTSINPSRFLVCLSEANRTFRVAARAKRLVVHALGRNQIDLAQLFGQTSGDDIDKFARCAWRPGRDHVPVLEGVPAWFAGAVLERVPLGDHTGYVLAVDDGYADAGVTRGALLTYADVAGLDAAHDA